MWYLQEHNSCIKLIHPWLPLMVEPLASVCILFICHSSTGVTEDFVVLVSTRREQALPASYLLSEVLIEAITICTETHSFLQSSLPHLGWQHLKRRVQGWRNVRWNKWWALWVFLLFLFILGRCAPGYFGNPQKLGGSCRPCSCNNNGQLGSCHPLTGGKMDSHLC